MALTHEHVQDLTAPFTAQETEFFGGFAYISEVGVTSRLDYVDPAWSIEHLKTEYTPVQVAVWLRLTVCGVSRDGVGMAKLTLEKKDGTTITAGEPEKSAATDALRRAARLFGIGRYLLLLPDTVKDEKSLTRWLHDNMGIETAPPRKNEPAAIVGAESIEATWDELAVKRLVTHYSDRMTVEQLLSVLAVSRFGEWTRGENAAYQTIENHIRSLESTF